ncbi:ribokinase [Mariniblastus fucicola]|uniref:Ribokinase n=1 Tax=Mariniblastus fucicola TaxID=980251 RepID=A0A5B9PFC6_9BACT|nr:ribokinase [Mariniblastus fucicola]QEG21603.1 Ribokinase [Mariniblastus fucicola]
MSESKTPRICVVGSANIDLIFRTPRMPALGETIAGTALHQCMGGKGANQAVVAARLGGEVTFIASVGSDAFGAESISAYEAEGIDASYISRASDQPTGTAAIFVDDEAENCIIVVAGANALLSPESIRAAANVIEQSDAVLCQLETPVDAAVEAFRIARAANTTTILTPAPAKSVTDELLSLCDVCVPNKTEITLISGIAIESEDDAIRAAEVLRAKGVKQVALTLGSEGVLVLDDFGQTKIPAMKVAAVDTTGAGDAFTGGLAMSLAGSPGLADAARRAAIVAAISVTKIGTQTSFPTLEEVEAWTTKKETS